MTSLPDVHVTSNFHAESTSSSIEKDSDSACLEKKIIHTRPLKVLSDFLSSTFSIFEVTNTSSTCAKKKIKASHGWTAAVRKVVSSSSMRRFQERFMWTSRCDFSSSDSDIWLLGKCYKASVGEASNNDNSENGLVNFHEDFSSRIWMTYRKGFTAIGDSKFTSDVNWGCMIRSSQMLVAQALIFHYLGRSWRKSQHKPYDPKYIEILHHFCDKEESAFSIHNLLQAGKGHGLAAGSWVGPYAMCRSWEIIAHRNSEGHKCEKEAATSLPMVVYIVSGDEDGERGGAPVVCVDVASRLCAEFCKTEGSWAPILLLVPLVLGLDKVNPRYIPLLWETFTFPQSLGILGGKPGASTYIIGVQDDKAFYLDPHDVQMAVDISKNNLEADTSSYHCSAVRHLPLEQIDPSLAIGFYCRDRDDFNDFCARAYQLMDKSNGAPLFTIAELLQQRKHLAESPCEMADSGMVDMFPADKNLGDHDTHQHEDDWQLL